MAAPTHWTLVASSACAVCGTQVGDVPGRAFYAVAAPYHAAVHVTCAPYFNATGRYPHLHPLSVYERLAAEAETLRQVPTSATLTVVPPNG